MYPGTHAAAAPEKSAVVDVDTGERLTYGELEERSVRLAHVFHDAGLRVGDVVALVSENNTRVFEVFWAAKRSGLYITAINPRLSVDEVGYIVADSDASALVVSHAQEHLATAVQAPGLRLRLGFGGPVPGYESYEERLSQASAERFADQPQGMPMLYSSGTTGRPKGVRPPLPPVQVDELGDPVVGLAAQVFGFDAAAVYLSPAPLYHAAPLRWSGAVHALGGTVVLMRKFDAERCLGAIEDHRVTHAQFVPTMFVRMLQLPEATRARYDVSSLRCAIHAAAPCPVEVKQRMIGWWGPVLMEYYSGTEANGITFIDSAGSLAKPGSVGRAILGTVHICDDAGRELPPGEEGLVYFERDVVAFEYHKDPAKTRASRHPEHELWTALGDIGYVDEDGYLFLTDRQAFTIISGGVNIYPQETENVLALHPLVHDVAVVGLPDEDMGERVVAFVTPREGVDPGPEAEREIIDFVRSRIAHYKAPREVRFVDALPRTETGKLLKRELKQQYS